MNELPQDLLDQIARYAATLIEKRARAQAKEQFERNMRSGGQVRDKGPSQKLTTRRQEAKALILQGLSDGEVEDRTGFCPAMIQRLRTSMGLYRERALTQEVLFAIAFSLLYTVKSYRQVGLDHGVSRHGIKCIAKKMKAAGLKVMDRPRGRPRREH